MGEGGCWGSGWEEERTSDTGMTRRVALTADCATFEDMAKGVGCQLRVVVRRCVELAVVVVKVVRFRSWSQAFSGPDRALEGLVVNVSYAYFHNIYELQQIYEKVLINS